MRPLRSSWMRVAWVLLGNLAGSSVNADAPLPPPRAAKQNCSLNGHFCLRRAEGSDLLRLDAVEPSGRRTQRWEIRHPARSFLIANDGEHWVELYEGANLLALDAPETTVMLTFHRRGETITRVMLRQLVQHPSNLPRSVSHWIWARAYGFEKGEFILRTEESIEFRFDFHTGRSINRGLFP